MLLCLTDTNLALVLRLSNHEGNKTDKVAGKATL